MATCPRCGGTLVDGHRCRPIWISQLLRSLTAAVIGLVAGAAIQLLIKQDGLPILGAVIGAVVSVAGLDFWASTRDR